MNALAVDITSAMHPDPGNLRALAVGASPVDSFAAQMDRAAERDDDAMRQQLRQLVSETFITPMLKMARNDPFKSDLFHGGSGEDLFGQQLDQELASRMGDSLNFPFVEAAYRKYAGVYGGSSSGKREAVSARA